MSVRVCINTTPDGLILLSAFLRAVEYCTSDLSNMPADKYDEQLLMCLVNTLESMFFPESGGP